MFLNHYPQKKVPVILYSESDYNRLLKNKPPWAMAIFDGKIRIPVNKYRYSLQDVIRFIYHEYAHALVFEITRGNCPLWLNEGIASKAEDFVAPRQRDIFYFYFKKFGIISLSNIPANFTQIKDVKLATLMYIESYLLVEFILKQVGKSGLKKILVYLGQKMHIKDAIKNVIGKNFHLFAQEWEKYIKQTFLNHPR